jgi:hypothetical protein
MTSCGACPMDSSGSRTWLALLYAQPACIKMTRGESGVRPASPVMTLVCQAESAAAFAVLRALCTLDDAAPELPGNGAGPYSAAIGVISAASLESPGPEIAAAGTRLRSVPFPSVVIAYKAAVQAMGVPSANPVHWQTLERHLRPVLSANDVHLFRVSARRWSYVSREALNVATAALVMSSRSVPSRSLAIPLGLNLADRRRHIAAASKTFAEAKAKHESGDWDLSDAIAAVPGPLWTDNVLQCASQRRLAAWRLMCATDDSLLTDIFPVSNSPQALTAAGLQQIDDDDAGTPAADMALALRVMKVIEQIVFAGGSSVMGPITATLTFAVLLEHSVSWFSVLNKLGIVASHESASRRRSRLVARREAAEAGAFADLDTTKGLAVVPIDSWNVHPLHSVKASGNPIPGVDGCLLQAYSRKRKRSSMSENAPQLRRVLRTASGARLPRSVRRQTLPPPSSPRTTPPLSMVSKTSHLVSRTSTGPDFWAVKGTRSTFATCCSPHSSRMVVSPYHKPLLRTRTSSMSRSTTATPPSS